MSRTIGLFRGVFINYLQIAYIEKFMKKGIFCPNVLVVKRFTYCFLGIGSCFGGSSINDLSSWCIISDKGRSCSSLSLSSNCLTFSVVLNEINSDLLCLIGYIMLDKNNLNHNIYNIRLCMTIYE